MKKIIEVSSKKYVTDGPQLWVSKLLHLRGAVSSNKIWEEYLKDTTLEDKDLIKSKNFLKDRVLHEMYLLGKIDKASA
jgi:hypothetical protein